MKRCTRCRIEKEELEFSKNKTSKDGLNCWCKDCCREHMKEYRKTDKYKEHNREYQRTDKRRKYNREYEKTDKRKEYKKKYQKEYRKTEKWKEYQKEYQKKYKNIDEHKKRRREDEKKKRDTDPKYKLDCNMAIVIGAALKGKKAGRKWEGLVGYTIEDLMKHLEKQFESWMNWDNYGIYEEGKLKWHLDHRKPKSLFRYTSPEDKEFKECWALENLQPLEAIENLKKSNKYQHF